MGDVGLRGIFLGIGFALCAILYPGETFASTANFADERCQGHEHTSHREHTVTANSAHNDAAQEYHGNHDPAPAGTVPMGRAAEVRDCLLHFGQPHACKHGEMQAKHCNMGSCACLRADDPLSANGGLKNRAYGDNDLAMPGKLSALDQHHPIIRLNYMADKAISPFFSPDYRPPKA